MSAHGEGSGSGLARGAGVRCSPGVARGGRGDRLGVLGQGRGWGQPQVGLARDSEGC